MIMESIKNQLFNERHSSQIQDCSALEEHLYVDCLGSEMHFPMV